MKFLSWKMYLYLFILNIIKANNTIILYFYENKDSILPATDFNSNKFIIYSEFINEKYRFPSVCSCEQYSNIFVFNRDEIPLKLIDPLGSKENSLNKIYIYSSVLNYQDFIYFYKILIDFPCLIENLSSKDFISVLNIFDIFRFKKNDFFNDFLRFILTSALYSLNDNFLYNDNEKVKDVNISVDLSRIVISELFKLFLVKNTCLSRIKDISKVMYCLDDYHKKIIHINENFLYLDLFIFLEIDRICFWSSKSLNLMKLLFYILAFQDYFISEVSGKHFVSKNTIPIILAKLNEIIFFRCSKTEFFLNSLKKSTSISTCKSISFIECKFDLMEEFLISELKSVEKYIFYHSLFSESQNFPSVLSQYKNLEQKINNGILTQYNLSKFIDKRTVKKLNMRPLAFQQNLETMVDIFTFDISKYPFLIYTFGEIKNFYIEVIFLSKDFTEFLFIELRFKRFFISGFKLDNLEIYDRILDISLSCMELTDNVLADLLIFPKLESISILNSKITFEQKELIFVENKNIIKFTILNSTISKKKRFFKFLTRMVYLESLNISSHGKFFIFDEDYNNICSFKFLKTIKYKVSYALTQEIPNFSSTYSIYEFVFGENFAGGTLSKLFDSTTFNLLRILTLEKISINKNDKLSLSKLKVLHALTFISCEINELGLYELFSDQEDYIIENLYLNGLSLSIYDLSFIYKLKGLKKLSLSIFDSYLETYKSLRENFSSNYRNIFLEIEVLNTFSDMDFQYHMHEEFENDKFNLKNKSI